MIYWQDTGVEAEALRDLNKDNHVLEFFLVALKENLGRYLNYYYTYHSVSHLFFIICNILLRYLIWQLYWKGIG